MRIKVKMGFTLIEMLVALAVFSILALSISAVFRSGLRTWQAGTQWSEENQTARNFYRLINKELQNSVNYAPEMPFEGSAKEISFMTIVDKHDPELGSFREIVRVIYRYDTEEKTLKRLEAGKDEGFDPKKAKEELIAENIQTMDFAYAMKPIYETETYRWKEDWKEQKENPRGVRVRMENFHSIVLLPTGVLGDDSALLQ